MVFVLNPAEIISTFYQSRRQLCFLSSSQQTTLSSLHTTHSEANLLWRNSWYNRSTEVVLESTEAAAQIKNGFVLWDEFVANEFV